MSGDDLILLASSVTHIIMGMISCIKQAIFNPTSYKLDLLTSDLIRLMWCRVINHVLPTFTRTGVFAVLSLTCQHILIGGGMQPLSGLKLACSHLTSPFITSILFAGAFHAKIIKIRNNNLTSSEAPLIIKHFNKFPAQTF